MTIKELLRKRIQVKLNYPGSPFEVDEILYEDLADGKYYVYEDYGRYSIDVTEYPEIFKEIPWWHERKVEDMPEYVKEIENGRIYDVVNDFFTYSSYIMSIKMDADYKSIGYRYLLPATEQEYNEYQSLKQ